MVLSSSKLKSFLDNKDYIQASSYANQQLSEDAISEDKSFLVSSVDKCTNQLAYYFFHLKPSSEIETHRKDICLLLDIFIHCLECLISLSNSVDMVDAKLADKILRSTLHVLNGLLFKEQNFKSAATFSLHISKYVKQFIKYQSEMSALPDIIQKLQSVGRTLIRKDKLTEAMCLFMPRICLLYICGGDISMDVKEFFDWRQKAIVSGDLKANIITLVDLENSEFLSDELKSRIIKLEIGYCRRYQKYNNIRCLLIDKLKQIGLDKQFSSNVISARLEQVWMGYFDNKKCKTQLQHECETIMKNLENDASVRTLFYQAIVSTWKFLVKQKELKQALFEIDQEKLRNKDNLSSANPNCSPNYKGQHFVSHLVSPVKDQEMLTYLKDAYTKFERAYQQKDDISLILDGYLTTKLILDCLDIVREVFLLLSDFEWYRKSSELLIKFSDQYSCFEYKVRAIGDILSHNLSPSNDMNMAALETLKETRNTNTSFHSIYFLLSTAWKKYHSGFFCDACQIAGFLIQEPLLNDPKGVQIEVEVLMAEIRLLILYCRVSQGPVEKLSNGVSNIKKNLKTLPQFQNQGEEVIECGHLQIGIDIAKSTNRLLEYFLSTGCSHELSRIALAFRTATISLASRRLMTYLNGWAGLAAEMKLFGKLTSQIARQIIFSSRIIDSNLLMAEAYLLCDDPTACRLELAEIEGILGGVVCSRNKENMKKQGVKQINRQVQMRTLDIELRDCNDENSSLGASPSLPRQLYNLPSWLIHPWEKCDCPPCSSSNPLKLAMIVYKFFTYHGIALDMNKDLEGSEWTMSISEEIGMLISDKISSHMGFLLPAIEIQNIVMDQFFLQRQIIEVLGRNGRLKECENMTEKQAVLSSNHPFYLKQMPVIRAMQWEQSILLEQVKQDTSSIQNMYKCLNTPEVVVQFEKLSLNPSAFKTPACKGPVRNSTSLTKSTNGNVKAPVRRFLPAPMDINITKPVNIIDMMNKEFEEIENMNILEQSKASSSTKKKEMGKNKNISDFNSNIGSTNKISRDQKPNYTNSSSSVVKKETTDKFTIYEDKRDNSPVKLNEQLRLETKIKGLNFHGPKKTTRKNVGKSSIPVPKATLPSTRVTRSKRT